MGGADAAAGVGVWAPPQGHTHTAGPLRRRQSTGGAGAAGADPPRGGSVAPAAAAAVWAPPPRATPAPRQTLAGVAARPAAGRGGERAAQGWGRWGWRRRLLPTLPPSRRRGPARGLLPPQAWPGSPPTPSACHFFIATLSFHAEACEYCTSCLYGQPPAKSQCPPASH